jgi:hypothetical protein
MSASIPLIRAAAAFWMIESDPVKRATWRFL